MLTFQAGSLVSESMWKFKRLLLRKLSPRKRKGLGLTVTRSGAVKVDVESFFDSPKGKRQLKRLERISKALDLAP